MNMHTNEVGRPAGARGVSAPQNDNGDSSTAVWGAAIAGLEKLTPQYTVVMLDRGTSALLMLSTVSPFLSLPMPDTTPKV
jgi:hypothetical protein